MKKEKKSKLSPKEIERYSRHILLPEIGGAGQQKLKAARVLVIGAGGLGGAALTYLASAGIGTLGIVDHDHVSLSNLQRQILFDSASIGKEKTQCASHFLKNLNPHCAIETYQKQCDAQMAQELLPLYDLILDCCDNFSTRYMLADKACAFQKTLISGAIFRFDGILTTLAPYKDNNPSYRDLFPEVPPQGSILNCSEIGVMAPLVGVIGSLQATEALKVILGIGRPLIGRLLIYNALQAQFRTISYKRQTYPATS